jgi:hypothetical protein
MRERERKETNHFVNIYKNKGKYNSAETHNKLICFNAFLNTIQTTCTVKILRAVLPLQSVCFAPHPLHKNERERDRKETNHFVNIHKNKGKYNSAETHNKLICFTAFLNTI